ncbi:hypothetical protein [uncultured Fibrella sp.]|uniref:hypothetical protein n=1 Tax=uncultured Fibrella sp. TaxID=1284596 RepID=UPI0035CC81F8
MSQNDDTKSSFPKGYEHTEARLVETTERIQALDEQIKNLPKDRGPDLTLSPRGFLRSRQPGSRDQAVTFAKQQIDALKTDTLAKIEQDTRNGDNKDGRIVRDTVREALFPNPFRGMSKAELAQKRSIPRDVEKSQDYMDAKLVQAAANRNDVSKDTSPTPDKKEQDGMSMSARFSMSLGYTKATEKTERATERTHSREAHKERD